MEVVDALEGVFKNLEAGGAHACAVRADGGVECWGYWADGRTFPAPGTYESVSAGTTNTCGLLDDGEVLCWGSNSFGQSVAFPGPYTAVSAGYAATCGLTTDGDVKCWGSTPYDLLDELSGPFVEISNGGSSVCGLRANGDLECWGEDAWTYRACAPPSCGNGVVDDDDECDDGDVAYAAGEYCTTACTVVSCGCPAHPYAVEPEASDALWVLRTAVGSASCHARVCDATGDGETTSSDALRVIRVAVGLGDELECPAE
jgi:hypothetical protein